MDKKSFWKKKKFGAGTLVIIILAAVLVLGFAYMVYRMVPVFFHKDEQSDEARIDEKQLADVTKDWQVYNNETYQYQIKIPANYIKKDLPTDEETTFTLSESNVKIGVFADSSQGNDTINDYLLQDKLKIESEGQRVKGTEAATEKMADYTALSQIWDYYSQDLKIDVREKRVVAKHKDIFYNIDFLVAKKDFQKFENDFDLIIQSLRLY
jgi:hypothetical protein